MWTPITAKATSSDAGTDQRGANFIRTTQHSITGAMNRGADPNDVKGARHRGSSTPASIACASAVGIFAMSRPRTGSSPVRTISTPTMRNAPTAAGQPPSTIPAEASSAAPGVDHASVTGIRDRQASHRIPRPKLRVSANRPLDACA
ncbi:hypothetical protein D3C73_1280370 [compost metagenome]